MTGHQPERHLGLHQGQRVADQLSAQFVRGAGGTFTDSYTITSRVAPIESGPGWVPSYN